MGTVCSIDELIAAHTKPVDEPLPPLRLSVEQQEAYARGMADAYKHVLELMTEHEHRGTERHTEQGNVPEAIRDGLDTWT